MSISPPFFFHALRSWLAVTVADDIGTDIFCTLFEVAKHKGQDVLLPRSSIAVQIKSNRDPVDVASKLDYLHHLEAVLCTISPSVSFLATTPRTTAPHSSGRVSARVSYDS
jgi:hypothetical protein